MKTTFGHEFIKAAKEAPRVFFAPLLGAAKAVRAEFERVQEDQRSVKIVEPQATVKR